jgi:hypothetical protein
MPRRHPVRLYATEPAPDLPRGVGSMMLRSERDVLYSIAKNYYRGRGDIIDAGVFMGASTFCFAKGLERGGRAGNVHSYEFGVVTRAMRAEVPDIGEVGADCRDYLSSLLRRSLGPVFNPNNLHFGDIRAAEYSGTVEILFLDIMKQYDTYLKCNELFMSRLIPGRSLVIQQDFYWPPVTSWYIVASMEALSPYFEVVDAAESSCVFLNTEPIPPQIIRGDPLAGLSPGHILRLIEEAVDGALTVEQYLMLELCCIDYLLKSRHLAAAIERFDKFERQLDSFTRGGARRSLRRPNAHCAAVRQRVQALRQRPRRSAAAGAEA